MNITNSDGKQLSYLTQWDYGINIYISHDDIDEPISTAPFFHIYNTKSNEAFVVQSVMYHDGLEIHVPNAILQESLPITFCAFTHYNDIDSGESIFTFKIPVKKKKKPADYVLTDDINVVNIYKLKTDLKEMIDNIPDDYTELSENVTALREDLSEVDSRLSESIVKIKDNLIELNCFNYVNDWTHYTTNAGITYVKEGFNVIADGVAENNSYYTYFNNKNSLGGLTAGEKYFVDWSSDDSNVNLQLFYVNANDANVELIINDGVIIIPYEAKGLLIRARILRGVTVHNALFKLVIRMTSEEISSYVERFHFLPDNFFEAGNVVVSDGVLTYTYGGDKRVRTKENTYIHLFNGDKITCDNSIVRGIYVVNVDNPSASTWVKNYNVSEEGNYLILTAGLVVGEKEQPFNLYTDYSRAIRITSKYYYELDCTQRNIEENNEKIMKEIDELKGLPYYWLDYLSNKHSNLIENDMSIGFNGISFAFISDMHWRYNHKNSPKIIKWIQENTSVKNAIFCGDLLSNRNTREEALSDIANFKSVVGNINLDFIFGNHDLDTNGKISDHFTEAEYHAFFQKYNNVNWEKNTLCGYRDFDNEKIRFIYWDYARLDFTKLNEWINELSSEWSVVIFTHIIYNPTPASEPSVGYHPTYGVPFVNNIDSIYGNTNATIIGVITGHLHRNYSNVTTNGCRIIATTCDAGYTQASNYDDVNPTRTPETTTEQAFDLFYINTDAKKIKVVRIGAGDTISDREFNY